MWQAHGHATGRERSRSPPAGPAQREVAGMRREAISERLRKRRPRDQQDTKRARVGLRGDNVMVITSLGGGVTHGVDYDL